MNNEISTIISNLDQQLGRLEVSIFNLSQANQSSLPDDVQLYIDNEIQYLRDTQDEIRNNIIKLREANKSLTNDKTALQSKISALDDIIIKLKNANTSNLPTNTKNRLTLITNYLVNTRNEITAHLVQFGQAAPSFIQKMLAGAKALCEEHEDIVKDIIGEPTITCVTQDPATTPTANADSDTPCFENVDELAK